MKEHTQRVSQTLLPITHHKEGRAHPIAKRQGASARLIGEKRATMAEQKQSSKQQIEPLYYPADFYMVRASALPVLTFLQLSSAGCVGMQPDLDEALSRGEQTCADILLKLASRPQVRQALALASPSLAESLERFLRGGAQAGQRKRLSTGLLRYLIRMSTRPTPFGLFAGVAVGSFAEHTDLRLGETAIARFRTRPDMHWLLSLLRKIEEDPILVAQLNVRLNQTAYLVGERAVLPFADIYGEQDNEPSPCGRPRLCARSLNWRATLSPTRISKWPSNTPFPRQQESRLSVYSASSGNTTSLSALCILL